MLKPPTGKIGRAHWKRAEFPLWPALDALGISASTLAAELASSLKRPVSPQQLSYWANGTQWAPIAVVRAIEQRTDRLGEDKRVRLGHWPQVKDKDSRLYWRYGKPSFHPNRERPPPGRRRAAG